jgi:hypothetical protein
MLRLPVLLLVKYDAAREDHILVLLLKNFPTFLVSIVTMQERQHQLLIARISSQMGFTSFNFQLKLTYALLNNYISNCTTAGKDM